VDIDQSAGSMVM